MTTGTFRMREDFDEQHADIRHVLDELAGDDYLGCAAGLRGRSDATSVVLANKA